MDTTKLTSLERAVYGQNLINKLTVENVKKLAPQLETYLNKKIELSNGGKSKNFVITLHEFENKEEGQHLRSFVSFEYNTVWLNNDVTVKDKTYESGGYGVSYYKRNVIVGYLKDGILIEAKPVDEIIKVNRLLEVFDAKKVKSVKEKISKIKEELRDLEYSIHQFKDVY